MKILMSICLVVPAMSSKGNSSIEMYNDSGLAIVAFFAFLLFLYLLISTDKTKKNRIRNN